GVANLLAVDAERREDPRRTALVDANDPQHDVHGGDEVVTEPERLAERELERLLRVRRERNLPGELRLLAAPKRALDLRAQAGLVGAECRERRGCGQARLGRDREQQMLRADVVVRKAACLLLREADHLTCLSREALEHPGPRYAGPGRGAS